MSTATETTNVPTPFRTPGRRLENERSWRESVLGCLQAMGLRAAPSKSLLDVCYAIDAEMPLPSGRRDPDRFPCAEQIIDRISYLYRLGSDLFRDEIGGGVP